MDGSSQDVRVAKSMRLQPFSLQGFQEAPAAVDQGPPDAMQAIRRDKSTRGKQKPEAQWAENTAFVSDEDTAIFPMRPQSMMLFEGTVGPDDVAPLAIAPASIAEECEEDEDTQEASQGVDLRAVFADVEAQLADLLGSDTREADPRPSPRQPDAKATSTSFFDDLERLVQGSAVQAGRTDTSGQLKSQALFTFLDNLDLVEESDTDGFAPLSAHDTPELHQLTRIGLPSSAAIVASLTRPVASAVASNAWDTPQPQDQRPLHLSPGSPYGFGAE